MDNIRYGKLDATEAEVIEVAKAVHAHDFIVEMEMGIIQRLMKAERVYPSDSGS